VAVHDGRQARADQPGGKHGSAGGKHGSGSPMDL
jgi:hypothetical protein